MFQLITLRQIMQSSENDKAKALFRNKAHN